MKNVFESVYQFTTEDISQYFPLLSMQDKSILTVGSSGDQAFAALLFGAGKVTLYDISPNTYEFVKLKRDIILKYPRKKAYDEIIKIDSVPINKDLFAYRDITRMNPCFQNDENYEKTRELLKSREIVFIEGDIFKMDESLSNEKYDRILFSNILQYIDYFISIYGYEGKEKEFIRKNFIEWLSHLNDKGILQLLYIYSVRGQCAEIIRMADWLNNYPIYSTTFNNINGDGTSAILTYRKK